MSKLKWTGERMTTDNDSYGKIEHLHRYAFLNFILKKHMIVLDVACGEGYGTNLIAEKAHQAIGIDISTESIMHAKEKYKKPNIEFINANATKIPVDDHSADIIVSFETIEHLKDHDKLLLEFKRILKHDGILIISTPDKRYYKEEQPNPFHLKELDFDSFNRLLKKYFSTISFYHQKNVRGSLIYGDKLNSEIFEFRGSFDSIEQFNTILAPEFNIAIATDYSLSNLRTGESYFDYSKIYFEEIKLLRIYKWKYNNITNSRRFKMINRFLKLFKRSFELI